MITLGSARSRRGELHILQIVLTFAMVLASIPFAIRPAPVLAATEIKWPFASGAAWYVSQGYNTSPKEGWSHFNCDPQTLKDSISQTSSCSQYYQYKYSFDLKRLDGNTSGQSVLSPVNGTIRWIDEAYGGMSINLGNGFAVAYFHTLLADGLAAGQSITQGQLLGTVAPGGQAGNGGTAHIHLTLWQTTDGGNWSRIAIPFTDEHGIDGYDFPALGDSVKNQHYQEQVVSSNTVVSVGTGTPPATPSQISPATGTTYQTTGATPTLTWSSVSGATQYQVVVNDGGMASDWLSTTSWTMPALGNGQYAWQVRARNSAGTSNLSAKWVFWVDPANGGSTPTPTPTVTGTPGALGLSLNKSSTTVGADVQASGSGFGASETVNLYLDSTSTTAIATVTSSSIGSFTKTFAMPEATGGNHSIIAKGATSKKQASASIRVNPSLSRTPYQGPPGTTVAVTVHGFGASETVRLNFDSESGALLGNVSTNAKGAGSVNVTMPQASNGWHDYVGTGQTSDLQAWGALYVERSVVLSPTSGAPGSSITVTAKGFPASENVTVAWNKTATVAGTSVCTGKTTSSGNYSCTFSSPQSVAGGYPVAVTSSSGASTSATFVVTGPAGISINPISGAVMSNVTISGGGFQANEQVKLSWDSAATWVTVQADANGAFTWAATIPSLSTAVHSLKALGATSAKSASTTFTVTATGGNNGSSMIEAGTYRVTATIEGLVGHTTSNGHLITPFDHFVSLPACTESSCDWLTAGSSSTYVADCNDNCYVRVMNPVTEQCSVAPVYDVGPWFTNDNWWDPANKRVLNTRSGAVNQLAQGYTGADAAKNGLDVGYGISNGIGISNVGYQVGNRAAIDIADGTWVDIGFDQDAGIGTVVVTMLWQTGENHITAAAACGQDVPKFEITLDPATGPVGTTVEVHGTLFGASETVKIYLDSSSTTALASVRTDSDGSFTKSIVIPTTANGAHRIHAVGQSTRTRTAATFTVTDPPKPSLTAMTPSSGPAGTDVQITGVNFLAGETVKIYLDSSKTTALTSAKANSSGAISATVTIPDTVGGEHRIHAVGQTSKNRTAKTLIITPTVTLSTNSGQARKTITVFGKGFGTNETVGLYWDGSSRAEATGTTDANGVVQFDVKAPWTNGDHTGVAKGSTSKLEDSVAFEVIANIKLTPNSGDGVDDITVRGTGFAPATQVNIFWNRSGSGNLLCSVRTSSTYGTFTCSVSVPASATVGANTILAIGGGVSASATFTLTAPVASQAAVETATPTAIATPEATESPTAEATATPEPTEETTPEASPTEAPTGAVTATEEATPTATPEPVERSFSVDASADTSVSASTPDQVQTAELVTSLAIGGENGEVTLLTFQIDGIAGGTVVSATLVLTGSGESSATGGTVLTIDGFAIDESTQTYDSLSLNAYPAALTAGGSPATVEWIEPGVETRIDVSGSVTADGTITFVIPGTVDAGTSIASRESGYPARLEITVVDPQ